MKALNGRRPLSTYVGATALAAGSAVVFWSASVVPTQQPRLNWIIPLAVLSAVGSGFAVPVRRTAWKIAVGDALAFIAVLVVGASGGIAVVTVAALARSLSRHTELRETARELVTKNVAILAGSLLTTAIFGSFEQILADSAHISNVAASISTLAISTYLAHSLIGAAIEACDSGVRLIEAWRVHHTRSSISWASAIFAGAVVFSTIKVGGLYVVLGMPILFIHYLAYRLYFAKLDESNKHILKLTQLHLATIESLALAIDAKDQMAQGHIRRVTALVEELARAIDYPESEMEGLRAAALLHDIGKLAVPEHILNKPGKLSAAEFSKIMVHPVVAADILSSVEFPYQVVPIVKHHHEKFDGTGYPSGLKGEQIPLGARILTIVDCYDALNSSRPYRARYPREKAIELMQLEAGRTFDPELLDIFLGLVHTVESNLAPTDERHHSHHLSLINTEAIRLAAFTPMGLAPKSAAEKALRDIAAAQREVLSLYEISQTLGSALRISEVLPIIAAKLENIANFTTFAIYLAEGDHLRAAYVSGKNAEMLKGAKIQIGEGEAGWVAKHRQALIGGTPLADMAKPLGRLQAEDTEAVVGRAGVMDLVGPMGPAASAYRSTAIFPLLREDSLVGALALYSEEDRGYTADEVRLLETISGHAAVAVYNALAFERTEESALTDRLTGLPNSRYMYSFFDQERSRAERSAYPLVLMMMDLDGFKRINDTYGHHIGDEILRRTAAIVRRRLRAGDTLIRYAGDEFVAVLHHATPDIVQDLKHRLQNAVDNFAHEVRPGRVARVGISIGFATYDEDGGAIDELMEVADERMYQDKIARKRGAVSPAVIHFPAKDFN